MSDFQEGDTVYRVEREGQRSYGTDSPFTVVFASDRSLVLYGHDTQRAPTTYPERSRCFTFTDCTHWSSGEPKYVMAKSVAERLAEELMA